MSCKDRCRRCRASSICCAWRSRPLRRAAVRPGMSELEVIAILGSPTSMRTEEGARVLLYALEIGASGFLVGSVRLRERSVESVQNPTLR